MVKRLLMNTGVYVYEYTFFLESIHVYTHIFTDNEVGKKITKLVRTDNELGKKIVDEYRCVRV